MLGEEPSLCGICNALAEIGLTQTVERRGPGEYLADLRLMTECAQMAVANPLAGRLDQSTVLVRAFSFLVAQRSDAQMLPMGSPVAWGQGKATLGTLDRKRPCEVLNRRIVRAVANEENDVFLRRE